MIYKMKRFRQLAPQDQFLILFTGLWLGLMVWLHCKYNYMSHRHIMPLVIFEFAWIFKGLHGLVLIFGGSRQKLHRNTAIAIGICIAPFIPKLIRPGHADKAAYKQAGLWLKNNTPTNVTLAVFDNRIGFYAERPYLPLNRAAALNQDYLIIKASDGPAMLPETTMLVTTVDKMIQIYRILP